MASSSTAIRFLRSMLVTILLTCVGWFTDARQVMGSLLIGWAAVAFFPLIIVAIGVGIMLLTAMITAFFAALSDDAVDSPVTDSGLIGEGITLAPSYYQMLARIRHAGVWGGFAGILAAGLILWGLIALFIVPREGKTVETLLAAQAWIDAHYAEHRSYPEPSAGNTLVIDSQAGPAVDGFDKPLQYVRSGQGRLGSYTLRSSGYDGRVGNGDDFCISGATKLTRIADRLRQINQMVSFNGKSLPLRERLNAIHELRCNGSD